MDSTRVSAKEVINEVVEATNLEPDDSTECNYFFKELCCFSLVFVLKANFVCIFNPACRPFSHQKNILCYNMLSILIKETFALSLCNG